MTQLTAAERLAKVKTALGINGTDYQNETLTIYIDEVVAEMIAAGVRKDVAYSAAAVGCIACGVNDLWNYTSGGVKHSEYFNRRMVQLALMSNSGTATETTEKHERIVVDHLTNTVAFSIEYTDGAIIRVFVNGISVVRGVDYTTVANNITFTGNLIAGTEVDVFIYE